MQSPARQQNSNTSIGRRLAQYVFIYVERVGRKEEEKLGIDLHALIFLSVNQDALQHWFPLRKELRLD